MPPLVAVEEEVYEVSSFEESRTATRWTVGADLGVGTWGGRPELSLGIGAGLRQDRAFGEIRVEGVYDDPNRGRAACEGETSVSSCTGFPVQNLARGSLIIGVPTTWYRRTALDVGLGLAWGVRAVSVEKDHAVRSRVSALYPGAAAEVALRFPMADGSFVRVAAHLSSFVGRNLSLNADAAFQPEELYFDPWAFPGDTAVGLRFGLTR